MARDRRSLTFVVACCAAATVLLAGCTSGTEHRAAGTPVPRWTDSLATSAPGIWATSIDQPVPVLDPAGVADLGPEATSLPWKLVDVDGRAIRIAFSAGGGCTTSQGVETTETAAAVTITVVGRTDTHAQACAADARSGAGTVTLAAPLGSRALVHAPVAANWANAST